VLVLEHAKQGFCLGCKTAVCLVLEGANLQLRAMPIPKQAQEPIIMPKPMGKG
jgi:hypothetical protein